MRNGIGAFPLCLMLPTLRMTIVISGFVTIVAGTGCNLGKPPVQTGEVTGKVIWKGEPLRNARISFNNPDRGMGSLGTIDANGFFQFPEPVPVGNYVVSILPPAAPPPLSPEGQQSQPAWNVPAKYSSENTSDLRVDVYLGKNNPTFELKE